MVELDHRHSVDLIADTLRDADRTTIVTTGPLTNVAMLLRTAPDARDRIEQIVTLGGAWGLGNKTAAAEWNILCDPEAASVLFSSGLKIALIPVDAAAEVGIDDGLADEVESLGGEMAALASELLRSLVSIFRPGLFSPPCMPLKIPARPSSRPSRNSREPYRPGSTWNSQASSRTDAPWWILPENRTCPPIAMS